jgi:hypothetical protein
VALTSPEAGNRRYTGLVILLFLVAGWALAVGLSAVLASLGGETKAVCAAPPLLEGQLPQLAIFGALTVCLLAGGLTSGWCMRAVHRPGHERARAVIEDRRARLVMRLAFITVFLLLTLLMILETWALSSHAWPITSYVRCANQASGPLSALGAGIYSFLAGRWLWVSS